MEASLEASRTYVAYTVTRRNGSLSGGGIDSRLFNTFFDSLGVKRRQIVPVTKIKTYKCPGAAARNAFEVK